MKRFVILFLLAIILLTMSHVLLAQEGYWTKPDSLFKAVQPTASMQLWSTYSMNEKVQVVPNGPMESMDDRMTVLVRRARFGFKGKPYKKLNYVVTIQYDNLGKDRLTAVRGGTNTGTLGILDAYLSWKPTKKEWLLITAGYLQPQFSRECITGDLLVNSLDKSPSQGYIRQHITGKGYGRVTGMNAGGMKQAGWLTLAYNVGIYSNNTTAADPKALPETTGIRWSPLTVERFMISFGDPESTTYATNYDANNYFNKRKGLTLAIYRSQQGQTDIFAANRATGVDALFNYRNLNLDAEWNWLERKNEGSSFRGETGHIRVGYNVILANKVFLEPTFMAMSFNGSAGYTDTGSDRQYDYGVNWYINKKNNKLALHYIVQQGKGDNGFTDGTSFQKGNFWALAYVLIM